MTQADVNLAHPFAAGVGGRCARELEGRPPATLLDHFDLPQRQPADPACAERLEEGFLRSEADGERLRPVDSVRAARQLGGTVDSLFKPSTVRGERSRDSFRLPP